MTELTQFDDSTNQELLELVRRNRRKLFPELFDRLEQVRQLPPDHYVASVVELPATPPTPNKPAKGKAHIGRRNTGTGNIDILFADQEVYFLCRPGMGDAVAHRDPWGDWYLTNRPAVRIKAYLNGCLKKCDNSVVVRVLNPAFGGSMAGNAACGTNGPSNLVVHDNGCGMPFDFQGAAQLLFQVQNRWHKDGPKDTAAIIELATDLETGQDEWQLVQIEDHFARLIWGIWDDPPTIQGFGDGVDPRQCGTPNIGFWEEPPCDITGKFFVARYLPELHAYKVIATVSAWMGDPELLNHVWGGSESNDAFAFAGCSLAYVNQPHYGWKCDLKPTEKAAAMDTIPRDVVVPQLRIGTDSYGQPIFKYGIETHYVCRYQVKPDGTIEMQDDCTDTGYS